MAIHRRWWLTAWPVFVQHCVMFVGEASRLQHRVRGRLLVGHQAHPGHVQIGPGPGVLEGTAGCCVAHRGGVVAVEGWVQVDEVNRRGVEAAQDVQVVPGTDGLVSEIGQFRNACG